MLYVAKPFVYRLVFLFVLFYGPAGAAAQNLGTLTGTVTDLESAEPFPATVLVHGTFLQATTDTRGRYTILGIPAGTYRVAVQSSGATWEAVEVEIYDGATTEQDFIYREGIDGPLTYTPAPSVSPPGGIGQAPVFTRRQVEALPVRGVDEAAALQAGVVRHGGTGSLQVRGGRADEVAYFVDGVRYEGVPLIPQAAIRHLGLYAGNRMGRYEDALSGVVSVTTRSPFGERGLLGSLEAVSSEGLDPFGYTLVSGAVGHSFWADRIGVFAAGEWLDQADRDPRWIGELRVPDALLDSLRVYPQVFTAEDASGNPVYIPIPGDIEDGATFPIDDDGLPIVESGILTLSDGTAIRVPEGVDLSNFNYNPQLAAALLTEDDFELERAKRGRRGEHVTALGHVTVRPFEGVQFRVGVHETFRAFDEIVNTVVVFAPEAAQRHERWEHRYSGAWTHNLSNSFYYQVQGQWEGISGEQFDPRFGREEDDFLAYGDLNDPIHAALSGYKNLTVVTEGGQSVPGYISRYRDGAGVSDQTVASLVAPTGGLINTYTKYTDRRLRLSTRVGLQLGRHALEAGGTLERRTERLWHIEPRTPARYVDDGDPERTYTRADGTVVVMNTFDDIPLDLLEDFVSYYGYDIADYVSIAIS